MAEGRTLAAIEGQPWAVTFLQRALAAGRVAHAYAFIGPVGSARTTTALAFATALLCPEGGCGACRACRMAAAGAHPDLHVITPTPPPSNPRGPRAIRIHAVRDLERQSSLRPAMGLRKVFIVDDADRMTGEAPQAFLKTLEEPPDRTVMILVLTQPRALPATVLSRCQRVRFDAPAAGPSETRGQAVELIEVTRSRGMAEAFQRFDRSRPDREEAEALVDAWWHWCRDLLLAKGGVVDDQLYTDPSSAGALREEAAAWTLDELLAAVRLCRDVREGLAVNVAPRLGLEMLLGRLAMRLA